MDIIIQTLGFKASGSLEDFIKEKLEALKSDKIVRANVILYKGPDSNPENSYCEIRLEVPGNDHFVKKHSQYFETSANECVEILTQMIKKEKEKHGDRKIDPNQVQDILMEGESENEEVELEDVVR